MFNAPGYIPCEGCAHSNNICRELCLGCPDYTGREEEDGRSPEPAPEPKPVPMEPDPVSPKSCITERPVVRNCWGCHADFPVSELEWFYYPLDVDGVRPSALYCPGCFDDQASVFPQEPAPEPKPEPDRIPCDYYESPQDLWAELYDDHIYMTSDIKPPWNPCTLEDLLELDDVPF